MSWKNAVRNKAAWRFLLIQLVHDGLCIDYVIRFLYTDTDFSFTTGFVFRNLVELFFDVAETSMRCPSVSTSSKGLRVKPYKTQLAFFQHIQPLNDEKKPLFKSVARSWISCHTHTHSVKEPKGDHKEARVLYIFKIFHDIFEDYRGKICQVWSAYSFRTMNNLEFVLLRCFYILLNYIWLLRETLKMSWVMMLPTSLNYRWLQVQRNQTFVRIWSVKVFRTYNFTRTYRTARTSSYLRCMMSGR